MGNIPIFLDYQIIDHLLRIKHGKYTGNCEASLKAFFELAKQNKFSVFMSKITLVEMTLGFENPKLSEEKKVEICEKDKMKISMAEQMNVTWLDYPCSGFDDPYSRFDVTFKFDGDADAKQLEMNIETIENVSVGDARQVVSCLTCSRVNKGVPVKYFISEDYRLINALKDNEISQLRDLSFIRLEEFMNMQGAFA